MLMVGNIQCVNFICLLNWFLWVGIIGFGLLILFLTSYYCVLVLGLYWCSHKFLFSIIAHHHSLILGAYVGVADM